LAQDVSFKDHFSDASAHYAEFRPTYPDSLFAWLASLCNEHECAWDCATGSGQAASGLAKHYKQVVATDASSEQIIHASGTDNVSFRVASAEASWLASHSVDLITVAQAAH
jgi:ubiquinone/menaquinone biosynthesis C-methylase UbiE